jgi:hypothetical protein
MAELSYFCHILPNVRRYPVKIKNLGVAEIGSTLLNELPASIGSPTENQLSLYKY